MSQTQTHILPADCPVTPLGFCDDTLTVLDSMGRERAVRASHLNRVELTGLFGGDEWLRHRFPKLAFTLEILPTGEERKSSRVVDFRIDLAAAALVESCKAVEAARPKDTIAPDCQFMRAVNAVAYRLGEILTDTDIGSRDINVQKLAQAAGRLQAISARDMTLRQLRGLPDALNTAGLNEAAAKIRKAVIELNT